MSYGILLLTNYSIMEDMVNSSAMEKSSNYSESFYRSEVPVIIRESRAPRWLTRIRDPASYLLITYGAMYFTLTFLGYLGAVKDSRRIMIIYVAYLGCISILQVTGVVLYTKYKPDLRAEVAMAINDQYKPEEVKRFTQFEFVMDLVMVNFQCCGVNNEKDFKETYANLYTLRSFPLDPRSKTLHRTERGLRLKGKDQGKHKTKKQTETVTEEQPETVTQRDEPMSRVVTGEKEPLERQVPVTCCKLNISNNDATKMLRNIYANKEDKLQLLNFAFDDACVISPDERNANVGEFSGCFDRIQGEIATPLRIGFIVIGLIQLCAIVFSLFVVKAAFYDWKKLEES